MYVFEYLRFSFKTQDFVMRSPIKAPVITEKCNAENPSYFSELREWKSENLEKRKVRSHDKVR